MLPQAVRPGDTLEEWPVEREVFVQDMPSPTVAEDARGNQRMADVACTTAEDGRRYRSRGDSGPTAEAADGNTTGADTDATIGGKATGEAGDDTLVAKSEYGALTQDGTLTQNGALTQT